MSEQSLEVDARGLKCPEPVMLLHAAIRRASAGQAVHLLATDPSTQRDVVKFCQFLGHDLERSTESNGEFEYWIRKAEA